jgi:hypothetical protein
MSRRLAERILEGLASPEEGLCKWCKHPQKRIRSAGLCNHCCRLKRQLLACESKLASFAPRPNDPKASASKRYLLERELKVARKAVELAKDEGQSYARLTNPVSALELETELRHVSKRWLGQDLFSGWANIANHSFDQTQKQLLFYIFRKMNLEYLRDRRRKIAEGIVFDDERDQGLA